MFCSKCGTEIEEGSLFCGECGTPVEEMQAEQPGTEKDQSGRKLPLVPLVAGAALLLAAAIGVGCFFVFRDKNSSGSNNKTADENEESNGEDTYADWTALTPLYTIDDAPSVNIHAQNYTASAKAPGIVWDNTLFY